MRVLVTGSGGFIGKYVTAELTDRGHTVRPFDLPQLDIRYPGIAQHAEGCDGIINLAGVLGTSELLNYEQHAVEANILGALNVLDAGRIHGIPVVQIGTGHKGQPNTYAITKACAEDLALARAQWAGDKVAVVRAFHVYGAGQPAPPPYGKAHVRKFFPTFASAALRGRPLDVYGDGEQLIDPVHASDVARVLADAISGPYGEVIEAGTGKGLSVNRIAEDIITTASSSSKIRHVDMRDGEPEGTRVVAERPACVTSWPYLVAETVDSYRVRLT